MRLNHYPILFLAATFLFTTHTYGSPMILPVPSNPTNASIPHITYEGARITLKAVARNLPIGSYKLTWDTDRDGDFSDEPSALFSADSSGCIRFLSCLYTVPNVNHPILTTISIQLQNTGSGMSCYGTYPLFIQDWTPDPNPENWTDEQVEVIRNGSVQEVLWYLYRQVYNYSGSGSSTITADCPDYLLSNITLLFLENGRLPAYPPGTYSGPSPEGWNDANDARWRTDPYSEITLRLLNRITQLCKTNAIPSADEGNQTGYARDTNGVPLGVTYGTRIPGTTDSMGIAYSQQSLPVFDAPSTLTAPALAAVAAALPALAGTTMQTGSSSGQTWEWMVQQMVDYVGYAQNDGGSYSGGWTVYPTNGVGLDSWMEAVAWGGLGLMTAERFGSPYGVIVDNRHKYRCVDNIQSMQTADGGTRRSNANSTSSYQFSAGVLNWLHWIGVDETLSTNGNVMFPNESIQTISQLVSIRSSLENYFNLRWTAPTLQDGYGWYDNHWNNGDYLFGLRNQAFIAGIAPSQLTRCNSYSMLWFAYAAKNNQIGLQPWRRQFNVSLSRAMYRHARSTPQIQTDSTGIISETGPAPSFGSYAAPLWSTTLSGLTLTAGASPLPPVARAYCSPSTVLAGWYGGNNGIVTFNHSMSFCPDANARIVAYQWDVDAENGLWWNTAASADYETSDPGYSPSRQFMQAGIYTVTLRVVDSNGFSGTMTSTINVMQPDNRPPTASPGGPYIMEEGAALQLCGVVDDPDIPGGDSVTGAWDLDNDNQFDDALSATGTVSWGSLFASLSIGSPQPIRLRATDRDGVSSLSETTLTIYPTNPVASCTATPNPGVAGQPIAFNGSASYHPNPARAIALYEWDFDGDGDFDAAGATADHTDSRIGQFNVKLRVTDDLGRRDETIVSVEIQAINPPVAAAGGPYSIDWGNSLSLDGSASTDPDLIFGDSIVAYRWDLDGDGLYDDITGITPTIPWTMVSNLMISGASNLLGLQVEDTTRRRHESLTTVIIRNLQTITFPEPDSQTESDTLILEATASSALPISYTLIDGPALLDGATVTYTNYGSVTISAAQNGGTYYVPAESVTNIWFVQGNPHVDLDASIQPDGTTLTLSLSGIPGRTYMMEAATSLTDPNWISLGNIQMSPSGKYIFIETNSPPAKFYRTSLPAQAPGTAQN